MFELVVRQGRTRDFSGQVYDPSNNPLTLQVTDVIRFKIGRGSSSPVLDVKSGVASSNGSSVTITSLGSGSTPAAYTVRMAQADLSGITPGIYDAQVILVDDSETAPADAAKIIDVGIIHVVESMGGSVTL